MKRLSLLLLVLLCSLCCMPLAQATDWCYAQPLYFIDIPSSPPVAGYNSLLNYIPSALATDENVTITSADPPKLIDSYLSPAGSPGDVVLLSGLRTYYLWSYASSVSSPSYFIIEVYKMNSNGILIPIYTTKTPPIPATSTSLLTYPYVSTVSTTFSSTDRIAIKIYANTTRVSPTTIHLINGGVSTQSYVQSGYFDCDQNQGSTAVVVNTNNSYLITWFVCLLSMVLSLGGALLIAKNTKNEG